MKRYKCVEITDIGFIESCIYRWLDGKKKRPDVRHFLSKYTSLTYRQVCKLLRFGITYWLPDCIRNIAEDVQQRLINGNLDLPPIEFRDKYDDVCRKWRRIGIQKPIHQIFDYVAVEACRKMFMAKIGEYQMASIPGRGQERGVKQIKKWIQLDPKHCRYWVKADIRHCYPSIPHDKIKARFARDIKNTKLCWLIHELIDSFPEGLSIGSYFSQFACNYYLSQAYHFVNEDLYRVRVRKGHILERVRLVYHQIWFMDDILLFGSSRKDLQRGMEVLEKEVKETLGLTIKPDWRVETTDYIDKNGGHRGRDIDMMGYRIFCDHVTIRRRTFKRHRKAVLRFVAKLTTSVRTTLKEARKIISVNGKFANSDSFAVSHGIRLFWADRIAKKIVATFDKTMQSIKERGIANENDRTCGRKTAGNPIYSLQRWGGRCMAEKEYCTARVSL